MDNHKELIERLRTESLYKDKATLEIMDLCMEASDAIAALSEENARLRAENIRWDQVAGEQNKAMDKLCAELEQVKRERDAAVSCIYEIEDDLDRGNDNDWAREHIEEWRSTQKEE